MRLGADQDRIAVAGAEVIAVSVDDEVRQAGMFARWPTPHVRYVSDPDGRTILRPLGLFDPDERGGIALPASIVFDPSGAEVHRSVGRDFADRTSDAEVYEALEALDLDPIEPPAGGPTADVPDDLEGYFRVEFMAPYFRGNRFAAIAIGGRLDDRAARAVARQHRVMCDDTLEAWDRVRPRAG